MIIDQIEQRTMQEPCKSNFINRITIVISNRAENALHVPEGEVFKARKQNMTITTGIKQLNIGQDVEYDDSNTRATTLLQLLMSHDL